MCARANKGLGRQIMITGRADTSSKQGERERRVRNGPPMQGSYENSKRKPPAEGNPCHPPLQDRPPTVCKHQSGLAGLVCSTAVALDLSSHMTSLGYPETCDSSESYPSWCRAAGEHSCGVWYGEGIPESWRPGRRFYLYDAWPCMVVHGAFVSRM
jgi:hypothetical protein